MYSASFDNMRVCYCSDRGSILPTLNALAGFVFVILSAQSVTVHTVHFRTVPSHTLFRGRVTANIMES